MYYLKNHSIITEKNISAPQRSAGIMSVGIALLIGLAVLGLCIYSGLKSISQGERVAIDLSALDA